MRVINQWKGSRQDCSRETTLIESSAYDSNIIGAQELTIHDNKKSYDCSGQIFRDKYIQEIYSKIKSELADWSLNNSRRDTYPKLVDIGLGNNIGMVWIWVLRIEEADSLSKSKLPFFLAFC